MKILPLRTPLDSRSSLTLVSAKTSSRPAMPHAESRLRSRFGHATRCGLTIAASLLLLVVPAVNADTWSEVGDAGSLPGNCDATTGVGLLDSIEGTLLAATDVDMYCIQIFDKNVFTAALPCAMFSYPDLWLFDVAGNGVALDDFCWNGYVMLTGALVTANGQYYLAISPSESEAMNGFNLPLWNPPASAGERAPDGSGAPGPVAGWGGTDPVASPPSYSIALSGTTFCEGPTAVESMRWERVKAMYR